MASEPVVASAVSPSEAPSSDAPAAPPPLFSEAELAAAFARVRERTLGRAITPVSTYRMQLNAHFTFEDARRRVDYLARLGVTDLYTSPCLKAMPGSMHGYDVIDHSQLNPELGTPEQFNALSDELQRRGMGLLMDTVPNHMGIERGNPLWTDVLENGPASSRAKFFDVDWDPVKAELRNKVLLPILGNQYGEVLEKGELKLAYADGAFSIHYYDHVLPLGPRGYAEVLGMRLEELTRTLGAEHLDLAELKSILTAVGYLPEEKMHLPPEQVSQRAREKEVIKRRLAALATGSPAIATFVAENVTAFNGTPGDPRSFDALDRLLTKFCPYRLAHWRVAGEEINYRRFFDINTLAAIRVEDAEVFEEAHQLLYGYVADGRITGLRIDHPDGLFDPTAYFLDLQEKFFLINARAELEGLSPEQTAELTQGLKKRWRAEVDQGAESPLRRALYVVVEKIQGGRERVPDAWAIAGNVGYRFANVLGGIFVQPSSEQKLTELYEDFTGQTQPFHELVYQKKRLVLTSAMASEVNVLARQLNRISEMNRRTRDFTLNSLHRGIAEFIAHFPVYRTYVDGWRPELDWRDVRYITWTIARAKENDPNTSPSLFDFLRDILLLRYAEHVNDKEREVMLRFAMKVQQLTGPVMAKGLEDTTFYIYNRLTSLNEVGGEPERFGTHVSTFHLRNQERAEHFPHSMLTSSTHDTKRSEDVRARINVITEAPELWKKHVRHWAKLNEGHKTTLDERAGLSAPSSNDEYLFYQTLMGAWPTGLRHTQPDFAEFRQRVKDYMQKAIKEAKVHTSWTQPDARYDEATARFVEAVTDPEKNKPFLRNLESWVRLVEKPGQTNALAQLLLKVSSPGVVDTYQGCELWDLSLVDPDNRRPVDYAHREQLLSALEREKTGDRLALCRKLWETSDDGRIKLYVLMEGLAFRQRRRALCDGGSYAPLEARGPQAERIVAFAREHQGQWMLAVAPRWSAELLWGEGLAKGFAGTELVLPRGLGNTRLRDVFTGRSPGLEGKETMDVGDLLGDFPVALLEGPLE